jgi:hypothetical protein
MLGSALYQYHLSVTELGFPVMPGLLIKLFHPWCLLFPTVCNVLNGEIITWYLVCVHDCIQQPIRLTVPMAK